MVKGENDDQGGGQQDDPGVQGDGSGQGGDGGLGDHFLALSRGVIYFWVQVGFFVFLLLKGSVRPKFDKF